MNKVRFVRLLGSAVVCCLLFSSCVFKSTKVKSFDETAGVSVIKSPTKAHLYDGSVIVFSEGLEMGKGLIKGKGIRYDLTRTDSIEVDHVFVDSVAFLEYYKQGIEIGPFLGSIPACIPAGCVGTMALLIAIWVLREI